MTSIKTLLENKQKALTAKLENVISHPTSKGDNSESAWIDFFRSFLPSKYSVDKGFIFDSTGQISEQIDIIIYDALYAPLIFETEAGEKYITAESVYAVFEVKQKMNKSHFKYAHDKIMSVKNLYRSSRPIIVAGNTVKARELTQIIGGILSYDSIRFNSLKDNLSLYPSIDLGCAINSFSFLTVKDNNEKVLDIKKSNEDEVILSFFFIILDELYKIGTVPALDIRSYANSSLEGLKLERGI